MCFLDFGTGNLEWWHKNVINDKIVCSKPYEQSNDGTQKPDQKLMIFREYKFWAHNKTDNSALSSDKVMKYYKDNISVKYMFSYIGHYKTPAYIGAI